MKQHGWLIGVVLVMLLVSACGQSQSDELPTLIPTATIEAETPTPEETASNTPGPRATLPPTWTFTPEPTETLIPSPTSMPDTSTPNPTPKAVSSACDAFGADGENSTREFFVGDAPTVYWTPVAGAELYRVFLYTYSGSTIRSDIYVDVTNFTFDPSYFQLGENYVWAVWPLDSIGDQMCFERGLELIPQRRPG